MSTVEKLKSMYDREKRAELYSALRSYGLGDAPARWVAWKTPLSIAMWLWEVL